MKFITGKNKVKRTKLDTVDLSYHEVNFVRCKTCSSHNVITEGVTANRLEVTINLECGDCHQWFFINKKLICNSVGGKAAIIIYSREDRVYRGELVKVHEFECNGGCRKEAIVTLLVPSSK